MRSHVLKSILTATRQSIGVLFCGIEFGTQLAFRKMNNFALPLVIMSWHRMVQEFFSGDAGYTFFDLGNYSETQKSKKTVVYGDHMYMETINEKREPKSTTLIASIQMKH
jgi:hypothetical protein